MMVGVALNRHPLARFAVLAIAHVGGGAGATVSRSLRVSERTWEFAHKSHRNRAGHLVALAEL